MAPPKKCLAFAPPRDRLIPLPSPRAVKSPPTADREPGNRSQPPRRPSRRPHLPMTDWHPPGVTRRDVLKAAGTVAAPSALAGVAIPAVHAAEDNTIRLALVGCGGRGTGAAFDALGAKGGPVKLVAMAD